MDGRHNSAAGADDHRVWGDELLAAGAELMLGAVCAGCGAPGLGPCARCRRVLAGQGTVRTILGPVEVSSAGPYAAELQALLIAAKERGALGVVPALGDRLAAAVADGFQRVAVIEPVALVPVPSTRSATAERGVDFVAALARRAAWRLRRAGVSCRVAARLRIVRQVADQSGLGVGARQRNLTGAYRAAPLRAGSVVVVDDIITSGASIAEAVRALGQAGVEVALAATVAATSLRRIG